MNFTGRPTLKFATHYQLPQHLEKILADLQSLMVSVYNRQTKLLKSKSFRNKNSNKLIIWDTIYGSFLNFMKEHKIFQESKPVISSQANA